VWWQMPSPRACVGMVSSNQVSYQLSGDKLDP
jgi:hypothetical protein